MIAVCLVFGIAERQYEAQVNINLSKMPLKATTFRSRRLGRMSKAVRQKLVFVSREIGALLLLQRRLALVLEKACHAPLFFCTGLG